MILDLIQDRFFRHGDLSIDFNHAEVWKGEQLVVLSATEYRLLLQFVENIDKIMNTEDLLSKVWGDEYRHDNEILWVSVARLRQKLEDDPRSPQHILTRSGIGYIMPLIENQ